MKLPNTLISILFVLTHSCVFAAEEIENFNIGNAEVIYYFQPIETGGAILTLNALVTENNNSLRGLKNMDQRRLSRLGQLIYQCKLMLYNSDKKKRILNTKDSDLISRNYSLYTGVDLSLATGERIGIQVEALLVVDDNSLFTPMLGNRNMLKQQWETVGDSSRINLNQINVNVLNESNIIETSESIEIIARFPVFQLEKPVSQWSYSFNLKDFKKAIQHIDKNCKPSGFMSLIEQKVLK